MHQAIFSEISKTSNMDCAVCNLEMSFLFKATVLNRYDVSYFKCIQCGLIQTEKPYWLKEAYSSAISSLDVGLVQRNTNLSRITENIIAKYFNPARKFLDYAGGYGLFVRMMRDKGYDFYRQDIYCANIFAQYHDLGDLATNVEFELITAFEVMEHLENPLEEITKILKYGKAVFFSTEVQPPKTIQTSSDWWYFVPETGQHIALYSSESLKLIAGKLNCFYYSDGVYLHVLSKKELSSNPFSPEKKNIVLRTIRRFLKSKDKKEPESKSLIKSDFEYAKEKLNLVQHKNG